MHYCNTPKTAGAYSLSNNDSVNKGFYTPLFLLFATVILFLFGFTHPVFAEGDADEEKKQVTAQVDAAPTDVAKESAPADSSNQTTQNEPQTSEPAVTSQPEQGSGDNGTTNDVGPSPGNSGESVAPGENNNSSGGGNGGGNTSSDINITDGSNDGGSGSNSESGGKTDITGSDEGSGNKDGTDENSGSTTDDNTIDNGSDDNSEENKDGQETGTDENGNQIADDEKSPDNQDNKDVNAGDSSKDDKNINDKGPAKPTDSSGKSTEGKKKPSVKTNKDKITERIKKKKSKKNEIDITIDSNQPTQNISNGNIISITGTTEYSITGNQSDAISYNSNTQKMSRSAWIQTLSAYEQLIVNMRRYDKFPAIVNGTVPIQIYAGKGSNHDVVGTLKGGGLCYILEDGEWAYIESGTVRGFVEKSRLITGSEAGGYIATHGGESAMDIAEPKIDPWENPAFDYLNITTAEIPQMPASLIGASGNGTPVIDPDELIAYAETFVGNPYVWGGTDPNTGADCSGFVKYVFAHFGIELPRTSYQQCYVGERITAEEAKPGDLLFYAENGRVYHVILYIGNGMSVQAHSSSAGIVVTGVDYNCVCWGCRIIPEVPFSSTQASSLVDVGKRAAEGDENARSEIIESLAEASESEYNNYGFPRSVVIAEAIQESNWMSFQDEENGGISPEDNNILGMNEELLNDEWNSPWTGEAEDRNVPQIEDGELVYGEESMRTYDDIEECMNDYAAFKTGLHPELQDEDDIDIVIEEGLQGYATDPDYQSSIKSIIEDYDLTQYDDNDEESIELIDTTNYSEEELETIWAIVASVDDGSYEGALAVVSTAMNRAEQNYKEYGSDLLSQLKAPDEFGYSSIDVGENPVEHYMGGNVPEYVKQAVDDCLNKGTKNHTYLEFHSSNRTGNDVQIGEKWYH